MSALLRRLAARRLSEADRTRAFAIVATVLLLAAAVLTVTSRRDGHEPPRATSTSTTQTVTRPVPVEPPPGRDAALRVSRRFLAGYLPFLYGHARARAIRSVSVTLRRRLIDRPPRVSPATRRRHPRIVSLTARPLGRSRWAVTATIADGGVATYPVELVVVRGRVVQVAGE